MNRITTYIRQSLQDIYPPEEVKALSMLICCDMLGLDALDIYTVSYTHLRAHETRHDLV